MNYFNSLEDISNLNQAYISLKNDLVEFATYNPLQNKFYLDNESNIMVNEIIPHTLGFANYDDTTINKYIDKYYHNYNIMLRNIFKKFLHNNRKYIIS